MWAVNSPTQESAGSEFPRTTHLHTRPSVSWVLSSSPLPPCHSSGESTAWSTATSSPLAEKSQVSSSKKHEYELRNQESNCVSVWKRILRASFRLNQSILQTKRKFIPNTQKLYDGGKGKIRPYLGKNLWLSQYSIKYFFWNQLFAWSLGHCLYNQKNRPSGRKMCGYVRLRTQLPEIAREGNIFIQSECLCSSWLIIVTSTASTKVLKIMTVPPLSPSFLFLPWGFRCPKSTINNSFCWNLALWGTASRNRRHRLGSFFLLELLL